MRLPYLDQRIHLHWGEAQQLADAIEWMLMNLMELEQPATAPASLMQSFGALCRVRGRLRARAMQEQRQPGRPPRKPWRFTVQYDELLGLMLLLPLAPSAGLAWGEIQRVSLNLKYYIDFTR